MLQSIEFSNLDRVCHDTDTCGKIWEQCQEQLRSRYNNFLRLNKIQTDTKICCVWGSSATLIEDSIQTSFNIMNHFFRSCTQLRSKAVVIALKRQVWPE